MQTDYAVCGACDRPTRECIKEPCDCRQDWERDPKQITRAQALVDTLPPAAPDPRETLRMAIKGVMAAYGTGWQFIGRDFQRAEVARELLCFVFAEPAQAAAISAAFIVGNVDAEIATMVREEELKEAAE